MRAFPWAEAMRFGLGVLKLPPDAFWRMSPRELAAAWGGVAGDPARPMDRFALEQLMENYPDGR